MRPLLAALLLLVIPAMATARGTASPSGLKIPEEVCAPAGEQPGPATQLGVTANPWGARGLPNPPLQLHTLLSGTWTPERQVFNPDGYTRAVFDVALDAQDHPVIVFVRRDPLKSPNPLVLYWSRYDGSSWTPRVRVAPSDDSMHCKPRAAWDDVGRLWLVWHDCTGGDPDLGSWYTVLDGGQWSTPARIDPPDGFVEYSPVIAQGGGTIWCTWYASTAGTNYYDVFVSQWTGSAWSSPGNLTYKIPGWHWFVDLAVDSQGQPHLLWGNTDTGDLLYAMKSNDGGWTAPECVNEAPTNGWPFCGVTLADDGGIDIMWVTVTADLAYRHRSAEGQWQQEQILFQHQGYGVAYPDIRTVDGSVSIVWGEYTGVTEEIYEVEPGKEVSRLDSGTWFYQETPVILAGADSLWTFWSVGDQAQTKNTFVYSTRARTDAVPVQITFASVRRENDGVVLEWRAADAGQSMFFVDRELPGEDRERISDAITPTAAGYSFRDASDPLAGTKYYLELLDRAGGTTTFGPYELLDSPGVLGVGAQLTASPNPFRAGVKLVARNLPAGDLRIDICSVSGRVVYQEPTLIGFGGGNAEFQPSGINTLPSGMYFVRVRVGAASVTTKVVKIE